MRALVELALAVSEEENVSSDVSELVKSALEEHRKNQADVAKNDIVELLRKMESFKGEKRHSIRNLKAQLKEVVNTLNALDRAWEFAQSTNNFLPVLRVFDQVHPHDLANPADFEVLTTVPKEFESPAK
jgi:hypothetical protein